VRRERALRAVLQPLDGTDTGACHINGDAPKQAKTVFAGCCPYPRTNGTNRGTCVPPELVSASQASLLPQDSCASNFLCAPTVKVKDQNAKFKFCQVPALSTRVPGRLRGRLRSRLHRARGRKAIFSPRGRPARRESMCAPCTDPTTGNSSGACD